MLSYRHAYHAGNFADLLKHVVLVQILEYMSQKPTALRIIDTHAGAGYYNLTSTEAQKNREFDKGIGVIWNLANSASEICPSALSPQAVSSYFNCIRTFNSSAATMSVVSHTENKLHVYPGSPLIMQHLARANDQLFFHELHPTDYSLLHSHFAKDKRIKLLNQDGFVGLQALLPPPDRRALVLIDPSYELKQDYHKVTEQLSNAYRRFSTGTYVIWYPVVQRQRIDDMEKAIKKAGIRNTLLVELGIMPDTTTSGMTASGLIIVNPPWTLWQQLEEAMPWLIAQLAPETGHYRLELLTSE